MSDTRRGAYLAHVEALKAEVEKYKARADAAERKVARVESLRDLWDGRGDLLAHAAGRLTAALADERADR